MINKKSFFSNCCRLLFVLFLILLLPNKNVFAQTYRLIFAGCSGYYSSEFGKNLKSELENKSNGELRLELHSNCEVGNNTKLIEQTSIGLIDFSLLPTSFFSGIDERINIFTVPYEVPSKNQLKENQLMQQIQQNIENKNILILSWLYGSKRVLISNTAINSLSDLESKKIITPYKEFFSALNANPVNVSLPEINKAFADGVADIVDLDITTYIGVIHSNSHNFSQRYLIFSDHNRYIFPFIINKKRFESLPPNLQQIIRDSAVIATKMTEDFIKAKKNEAIRYFENTGINVVWPNLSQWKEQSQSIRKQIINSYCPSCTGTTSECDCDKTDECDKDSNKENCECDKDCKK